MKNNFLCGVGFVVGVLVAILGVTVNAHLGDSAFWCLLDFLFWPLALAKWLILKQVNLSIVREAFSFLLQ